MLNITITVILWLTPIVLGVYFRELVSAIKFILYKKSKWEETKLPGLWQIYHYTREEEDFLRHEEWELKPRVTKNVISIKAKDVEKPEFKYIGDLREEGDSYIIDLTNEYKKDAFNIKFESIRYKDNILLGICLARDFKKSIYATPIIASKNEMDKCEITSIFRHEFKYIKDSFILRLEQKKSPEILTNGKLDRLMGKWITYASVFFDGEDKIMNGITEIMKDKLEGYFVIVKFEDLKDKATEYKYMGKADFEDGNIIFHLNSDKEGYNETVLLRSFEKHLKSNIICGLYLGLDFTKINACGPNILSREPLKEDRIMELIRENFEFYPNYLVRLTHQANRTLKTPIKK